MKINHVSPLAQLSEDEQLTLISWLEKKPLKEVLDLVALPRPQGFGIKTYRNTELALTPLIDSDPTSDGTFSHGLGAPTQETFRFNERGFNMIYSTLKLQYAPQNGS